METEKSQPTPRPTLPVPAMGVPAPAPIFLALHRLNAVALRRGVNVTLNEDNLRAALLLSDAYRVDPEYKGAGSRALAVYDFVKGCWEFNAHYSDEQIAAAVRLAGKVEEPKADTYWPAGTPGTAASPIERQVS